jgi:hypothetical protein
MNMNAQGKSGLQASLAGLLLAVCLAGCQSAGYQKSDAAATTMQAAALDVQSESHALEVTLTALRELATDPKGDLQARFMRFSKALDQFQAASRQAEATGQKMQREGAAYFAAWQKDADSINYEIIRNGSMLRRTQVTNQFDVVTRRYQDTHSVVEPLIAYLQDIRTALEADLTTDGIQALKPIINNADENASRIQAAQALLATELTASSSRMSSITPQNTTNTSQR